MSSDPIPKEREQIVSNSDSSEALPPRADAYRFDRLSLGVVLHDM